MCNESRHDGWWFVVSLRHRFKRQLGRKIILWRFVSPVTVITPSKGGRAFLNRRGTIEDATHDHHRTCPSSSSNTSHFTIIVNDLTIHQHSAITPSHPLERHRHRARHLCIQQTVGLFRHHHHSSFRAFTHAQRFQTGSIRFIPWKSSRQYGWSQEATSGANGADRYPEQRAGGS